MAVETIVRKINLSRDKPLRPGWIPFQYFVPSLEPVQLAGNGGPELFGVGLGFGVKAFVFLQTFYVRLGGKFRRRRKAAGFLEDGINIDLGRERRGVLCHV